MRRRATPSPDLEDVEAVTVGVLEHFRLEDWLQPGGDENRAFVDYLAAVRVYASSHDPEFDPHCTPRRPPYR